MTSLARRLTGRKEAARSGSPLSMDAWAQYFNFNGNNYPYGLGSGSYTLGNQVDEINRDFAGYVHAAYRFNGPIFACMLVRLMVFSQARFQFQQMRNGRPGRMFGTEALAPLETPWPNGTTSTLLTRMMQDADLAGNAYVARRGRTMHPTTGMVLTSGENRLRRLRPDWVTILGGSKYDPQADLTLPDAELLGYLYHPGGPSSGNDPVLYSVDEVAHFAPVPDPCSQWIGMSWLTPVLREIQADSAAMSHKLQYFEQGATANLVISMDPNIKAEAFKKWVAEFADKHDGPDNAYRTMYLGGGATAQVVGDDLKKIDFAAVQSHGEARIAMAAGVPPIVVGMQAGLDASTYANYGQARRAFGDTTLNFLWRCAADALATLIDKPRGASLAHDPRDIPFLKEDQKDEEEIRQLRSSTIHTLVTAGFTPDSVVSYVDSGDVTVLEHTGMFSVQLIPAGTVSEGKGVVAGTTVPSGSKNGKPATVGSNDVGRVVRALLNQQN